MEITPRNSDVTASVAVFLPPASPIEPQRHHDTDKKVVEVADADDLPSIVDLRNSKFNLDFKTEGRPSATAASIDVGHLSADKATRNSSSPGFAKQRSMSDVAVSASGAASLSSTPDMAQTLVVAEPGSPAAKAIDITNQFDGKNNIRQTSKLTFKKPDGNEIDGQHEQYTLTYGMMTGILNSAGSLNMFKQRLTMNDFMRVDKREFPANLRSKLAHSFKFKDYSPDIFRQIRRRFDIDSADYMVTLCGDFNYIEFMSNSKSGQFFFYSHDGRFMIKTQTQDESKFLRRILPHYYKFVMDNPNTLVTRFYGMHRVKMHHLKKQMHFVIMASVFNTPKEIHLRFDLKGSKVGRNATPHEKSKNGVLKDNDLVDEHIHLSLGPEKRAMMLEQLRKDVAFLKRMKIMDYSLLIGIHDSGQEILLSPTTHPTPPPLLQLTSAVSNSRQPSAASSPLQTLNDLKLHEFGAMSSHISDTASDDNSDDDVEFTDAPLSPRTLDTTPKSPSGGSIFCKDFGGVLGRLSTRKKNGKIYFVGIIDILQQYNTRKITETVFKGLVHNKKDISSVPPDQYGDRFLDFIEKNVLVDE